MEFVFNAWYFAAWADEVSRTPMPRRFLDIPVVLYRTTDSRAVALHDRCPHRFAPLHKGTLKGDDLECGYHGLCFDRTGACTHNPYSEKIPAAAKVRQFPVVERDSIVWIWMGDPAVADPGDIIDCSYIVDTAHWRTVKGYTKVGANYAIMIDNLMDLSHSEFIHRDTFGTSALKHANYEVSEEGATIHSNRWYDSGPSLPLLEKFLPTGGKPVKHWINMRWNAAGNLVLDLGMCLTGTGPEEGWHAVSPNILTPETRTTTHYFYSYSRNMHLDSVEIDEILKSALSRAFELQDGPMLESIQAEFSGDQSDSVYALSLAGDAGSIRVRRVLANLIDQERRKPI